MAPLRKTIMNLPDEILEKIFSYVSSYDLYTGIVRVNNRFRAVSTKFLSKRELKFAESEVSAELRERGMDLESPEFLNIARAIMESTNLTVYHDCHLFVNVVPLLAQLAQNLESATIRNAGTTEEMEPFLQNGYSLKKLSVLYSVSYAQAGLLSMYCARSLEYLYVSIESFESIYLINSLQTLNTLVVHLNYRDASPYDHPERPNHDINSLCRLKNLRIIGGPSDDDALNILCSMSEFTLDNLDVLSLNCRRIGKVPEVSANLTNLSMLQAIPQGGTFFGHKMLNTILANSSRLSIMHLDCFHFRELIMRSFLNRTKGRHISIVSGSAEILDEDWLIGVTRDNLNITVTDLPPRGGFRKIEYGYATYGISSHYYEVKQKFEDIFTLS